MQQLGYITFFLAVWFVIPYLLGNLLFRRLKKRWSWLGGKNIGQRVGAFTILLICALMGWLLEMLVLTGIKMML